MFSVGQRVRLVADKHDAVKFGCVIGDEYTILEVDVVPPGHINEGVNYLLDAPFTGFPGEIGVWAVESDLELVESLETGVEHDR